MVRWPVLIVSVLLVPLVSAGSSGPMAGFVPAPTAPVTLYFHLDGIQDFAINTQEPPATHASGMGRGIATHSLTCPGAADDASGMTNDHHAYHGYLIASDVDYGAREDGLVIQRVEGTNGPMALDQAPATLHWYLETDATALRSGLPTVIPDVVVEASVRESTGLAVSKEQAFEGAAVVAEGRTRPAMLSPLLDGHPEVTHGSVDGRHVYHFQVPLEPIAASIPGSGLAMRVRAYIDSPLCGEDEAMMPNQAWPYTGPDHRPRLEWNVADQVRFTRFDPVIEDGVLRFDAEAVAGWGSQDLDPASLRVELRQGDEVVEAPVDRLVQDVDRHHAGLGPATAAFVLEPPGEGWIQARAEAWNRQHTAKAEAYALVHPDGRVIAAEGPAAPAALPDTNGVPALPVALALAGIAVLAARRWP